MNPVRIQRSRQHKQISPNGLPIIYVGRPSKWGNPLRVKYDMLYFDASHRRKILSPWVLFDQNTNHSPEDAVNIFRDLMLDLNSHDIEDAIRQKFRLMRDTIRDLEGMNVSCWCKPGEPCHADILMQLANI